MTQQDLNRAIARATGDSLATIARSGFIPLDRIGFERELQTIDWDDAQRHRNVALFRDRQRSPQPV